MLLNKHEWFCDSIRSNLNEPLTGIALDENSLIFGSDQEKAIVIALESRWPECTRVLCDLHLFKNLKHNFRLKGIPEKEANKLIKNIRDNLMKTQTLDDFDNISNNITQEINIKFSQILDYFNKLSDILRNQLISGLRVGFGSGYYTNNACESMNFILKLNSEWKNSTLLNLIHKILDEMNFQLSLIQKALTSSTADMILDERFNEYKIDKGVWEQWTSEMQREAVLRFLKGQPPFSTRLISATDCSVIILRRVLNAARKPGYNKPKSKPNTAIAKRIRRANESSPRETPLLSSELE